MKLTLDYTNLANEFFEETRLLGVMAPIKDYQLCLHLNNLLGMDFRINNELEIQLNKKGRSYFFAVYEYNDPMKSLSHYVYNNQFDGEYLLPELKHLDFVWLLKGDIVSDEALNMLVNTIRGINSVQLVVELTNEKIKHKEHLIF